MDVLDYVLLAIAVTAMITGAMSGLMRRVASIAGLIAAVAVCWIFGDRISAAATNFDPEHAALMRTLAFALVFVLVYLLFRLVGGLFRSALSALKLGPVDRVAGALFSLFLWMLGASIVLNIYIAAAPESAPPVEHAGKPWRTTVVRLAPSLLERVAAQL